MWDSAGGYTFFRIRGRSVWERELSFPAAKQNDGTTDFTKFACDRNRDIDSDFYTPYRDEPERAGDRASNGYPRWEVAHAEPESKSWAGARPTIRICLLRGAFARSVSL